MKPELNIVYRPPSLPATTERTCESYEDEIRDLPGPHLIRMHINGVFDSLTAGCLVYLGRVTQDQGHEYVIHVYNERDYQLCQLLGLELIAGLVLEMGYAPDTESFVRS